MLLLSVLALACTACTTQGMPTPSQSAVAAPTRVAEVKPTATVRAEPTAAAKPQTIRVLRVMPVTRVTHNEEYEFNNCGGETPVTRSLSEVAQVHVSVTIAEQATELTGTTAKTIPPEVRDQLCLEIRTAYRAELDTASATVAETVLAAGAQERNFVTIVWEEHVYSGAVSFPLDGVAYTAEYTYTLEVPRAGSIRPGICTL